MTYNFGPNAGNVPPGTPRRLPDDDGRLVRDDPSHDNWGICNECLDPETAFRSPMTAVGYNLMKIHLLTDHGLETETPSQLFQTVQGGRFKHDRPHGPSTGYVEIPGPKFRMLTDEDGMINLVMGLPPDMINSGESQGDS